MKPFLLPAPGGVEVEPQAIDPVLCGLAVSDVDALGQAGIGTSPANDATIINEDGELTVKWNGPTMLHGFERTIQVAQEARERIVDLMLPRIPIPWRKLIVYMRYMQGESSRMGLHRDEGRDLRFLLEMKDLAVWRFNEDALLGQTYPEGVRLQPGDVVSLNNMCNYEGRAEHGVTNVNPEALRVGWLFKAVPV